MSVTGALTNDDTRKIFVSNIKTVDADESNSARVLVGCKPITGALFQMLESLKKAETGINSWSKI